MTGRFYQNIHNHYKTGAKSIAHHTYVIKKNYPKRISLPTKRQQPTIPAASAIAIAITGHRPLRQSQTINTGASSMDMETTADQERFAVTSGDSQIKHN
jgi:hypothetical protein